MVTPKVAAISSSVLLLLLLLAAALLAGWGPFGNASSEWVAVPLNDGEIFFGHLKQRTADTVELTNVFYVQKPSANSNQPVSIVSLVGSQAQCPTDDIRINSPAALYVEQLQGTSAVVQQLNHLVTQPVKCVNVPAPSGSASPAPAPG